MSNEAGQQRWVAVCARRLETLGLSPVVLALLEIVRAFGFLGSQALVIAQPLIAGFVSNDTLERTTALLDSPELLDQFRACLEGEESRG